MSVAILRQGDYLIASIQSDLTDREVVELRDDLAQRVGSSRARGIIVDVTAMDVIDSFVARALRAMAITSSLRGARTVIVGIQPDVAIALAHFNLDLAPLHAALDLEEGHAVLDRLLQGVAKDGG